MTRGMFCPHCGGFTTRTGTDLDVCRVQGCNDMPLEQYDPEHHSTLAQRQVAKS